MEAETRRGGNRRGHRSREEILEAAARVMSERGYAGTSISVLSAATGLPRSALYHHFQSKAELLTAVMERGANDFFEAMRKAHVDPPAGGTHRERLGWYLRRTAEVFAARTDFLRLHLLLLMSSEAADSEVAPIIDKVRVEGRAYMAEMIASAFEDEGPRVARAVGDELAYFAIAGFDGAFVAWQAEPRRSMVDQMRVLVDALTFLGEQLAVGQRERAVSE
jgi:AcrR family transcriptional regulator